MNDRIIQFEKHWNDSFNSVCYRLFTGSSKSFLCDSKRVNSVVHSEVWDIRFSSGNAIRHSAAVLIEELKREDPRLGAKVEKRIAGFKVNAGVNTAMATACFAAAPVFLAAAVVFLVLPLASLLSVLFGVLFAVSVAGSVYMLIKSSSARESIRQAFEAEKNAVIGILSEMGE